MCHLTPYRGLSTKNCKKLAPLQWLSKDHISFSICAFLRQIRTDRVSLLLCGQPRHTVHPCRLWGIRPSQRPQTRL